MSDKPDTQEHERLMCLAIKHCPKDHHDWKEILELTTSLSLSAPPSQGVVISRECKWVQDEDIEGNYDTYCGQTWEFNEGDRECNNMNYCHYCGGKITELQAALGDSK